MADAFRFIGVCVIVFGSAFFASVSFDTGDSRPISFWFAQVVVFALTALVGTVAERLKG